MQNPFKQCFGKHPRQTNPLDQSVQPVHSINQSIPFSQSIQSVASIQSIQSVNAIHHSRTDGRTGGRRGGRRVLLVGFTFKSWCGFGVWGVGLPLNSGRHRNVHITTYMHAPFTDRRLTHGQLTATVHRQATPSCKTTAANHASSNHARGPRTSWEAS